MIAVSLLRGRSVPTGSRLRVRPLSSSLVLLVGMLALVSLAPPAEASDASTLVSLANRERASRGIRRLAVDSELTSLALRHTYAMIRSRQIYHSRNPWTIKANGWDAAGENVGVGGTVSQVHSMFMSSGSHRATLLERRFDHVGVAAVRSGRRVWVTELFGGGPPGRRVVVARTQTYRAAPRTARAPVRLRAAPPVTPTRSLAMLLTVVRLDRRSSSPSLPAGGHRLS